MLSKSIELSFLICTPGDYWDSYDHLKSEHWQESEDCKAKKIVAALLDGVSVACLRIFDVKLIHPVFQTDVIGIGWVFTSEDYRGKGISSQLLSYTIENLRPFVWGDSGIPGFVLYSRERDLYRRAGFHVIREGEKEHLWFRLRESVAKFPMRLHQSDEWVTDPEHF